MLLWYRNISIEHKIWIKNCTLIFGYNDQAERQNLLMLLKFYYKNYSKTYLLVFKGSHILKIPYKMPFKTNETKA